MRRPLHHWPSWLLRAVLWLPSRRGLWSEAWLELWARATVDVARAEANDESGPWPVAMPKGLH